MTNDLIARLADDLHPVPTNAVQRRLGLTALSGLALTTIMMISWLGIRPDLAAAVTTANFWVKFGYTLALGILGAWAVSRVARPGETGRTALGLVPPVLLALMIAAGINYATAPLEERRALVMGSSALVCPFYILALSVPLLVGCLAFLRRMAPTNLPLAGLAGGLMAGALGAWIYSFHCTESGLPFLTLWYSLGIFTAAATGALAGRWALRW
ncbi:DUF1109 domain-containing protein [Hyphomicrobium sp. CS1GBMeth3]|uniref:NrsF family protein n=1 Tax=Hyphomicrobium sp. CS1GBMeth3 TaxID=1892845 RepID=UPI000931DD6F|nr:DUF1109 domain-containing protein [Hyphomicrobium sp. CS1GBMeth3]